MLYNGERIGDGTPPETDIAVDPIEGTTLTVAGPRQRHLGHRRDRAGHDVQPGPVRLHGEDRRRPRGGRRRSTSRSSRHREPRRPWPRPRASHVRDVTAVILDRDRHDDLIAEVREAGARIRLIQDGDVIGAVSTAWPDSRRRHPLRHRRHPRGRASPPRPSSAWAARSRAGSGPATTSERPGRRRRRVRPRRRCSTTDDLVRGDNCFFAATGITDGEVLKGVHYDSRRRHHPVARHAVEVGHRPPDRRPPPPREAARSSAPSSSADPEARGGAIHLRLTLRRRHWPTSPSTTTHAARSRGRPTAILARAGRRRRRSSST